MCKPFAIDDDGDVSVLGVNVASAGNFNNDIRSNYFILEALAISSIPLRSIFAATRVCMKDSEVTLQVN